MYGGRLNQTMYNHDDSESDSDSDSENMIRKYSNKNQDTSFPEDIDNEFKNIVNDAKEEAYRAYILYGNADSNESQNIDAEKKYSTYIHNLFSIYKKLFSITLNEDNIQKIRNKLNSIAKDIIDRNKTNNYDKLFNKILIIVYKINNNELDYSNKIRYIDYLEQNLSPDLIYPKFNDDIMYA
jgi:hypothetical protein